MKLGILTVFFSFFFIFLYAGEQKENVETRAKIKEAEKYAAEVNKGLKHFIEKKREISGDSSEGGELAGFFKGSELKKIKAVFRGEMGYSEESYYYDAGGMVLVEKNIYHYDEPFGKVMRKESARYYFYKNQLIARKLNAGKINLSIEIKQDEEILLQDSMKLKQTIME